MRYIRTFLCLWLTLGGVSGIAQESFPLPSQTEIKGFDSIISVLYDSETSFTRKKTAVTELSTCDTLESAVVLYRYLSSLTYDMTYSQLVTRYSSGNMQIMILEIEKAISRYSDPRAVSLFVRKAHEQSGVLHLTLLQGLKQAPGSLADNLFRKLLTRGTDSRSRITAVDAAGLRGLRDMIPVLIGFAENREESFALRCSAIRALARIPDSRSVSPLIRVHGESGRLKAEAKNALWTITGQIFDSSEQYRTWWKNSMNTFVPPEKPVLHFNEELHSSEGWNDFYGLPVFADRLVFIVDRSSSMGQGPLEACKKEILRIVRGMNPGKSFNVIFFNDDLSYWKISREGLSPATEENIEDLENYLKRIGSKGYTLTEKAMYKALAFIAPMTDLETVFLLTDGNPNSGADRIEANLLHLNRYMKIRINTLDTRKSGNRNLHYNSQISRFYRKKRYVELPNVHLNSIASSHDGIFRRIKPEKQYDHNLKARVSINKTDCPIREIIQILAEQTGNTFTVSYALREKAPVITLRTQDMRLADALWWTAYQAGGVCRLARNSIGFYDISEKDFPKDSRELPETGNCIDRKTAVTFSYDAVPLTSVLSDLSGKSGVIISGRDRTSVPEITCAGYRLPVEEAVPAVLSGTGFSYSLCRGGIIVYRKNSPEKRQQAGPSVMEKPVTLSCQLEPLSRLREFIRETATGKKLFIDREALKPVKVYDEEGLRPVFITLTIRNMQLDHALYWIARQAGLAYTVRDQHLIFSTKEKLADYRTAVPEEHKDTGWYRDIERKLDSEIGRFWLPEKLHLAIRTLQDKSGINIVADPSVISTYGNRPISLDDLKGFTFRDYLNLLTETPGLYYVISHGAVLISENYDGEFNPPVIKKKTTEEIRKIAQKYDGITVSEESLRPTEQQFIARLKTPVTIDMSNVPFWYAVDKVNKKLGGVNLSFSNIRHNIPISLSLKGVAAEQAFREIAKKAGVDCVINYTNLQVVFKPAEPLNKQGTTSSETSFDAKLKKKISVDFTDEHLWYIIDRISKELDGLSIQLKDSVDPNITLSLNVKDIEGREVLKKIAEKTGTFFHIDLKQKQALLSKPAWFKKNPGSE